MICKEDKIRIAFMMALQQKILLKIEWFFSQLRQTCCPTITIAITLFFHYTKKMITLLYFNDITGNSDKIYKIYFVFAINTITFIHFCYNGHL